MTDPTDRLGDLQRTVEHYLDLFDSKRSVGPRLLAEALYVARHGEQGAPDDLRPIIRDLPEATPAQEAYDRVLTEAARRALADPSGGRGHPDTGREALAERLGVSTRTVTRYLGGESGPSPPERMMMEQIVEES